MSMEIYRRNNYVANGFFRPDIALHRYRQSTDILDGFDGLFRFVPGGAISYGDFGSSCSKLQSDLAPDAAGASCDQRRLSKKWFTGHSLRPQVRHSAEV